MTEKILVVNVDYKLNFNDYLDSIIKKEGHKVNALSRFCFTLILKHFDELPLHVRVQLLSIDVDVS